MTRFHDRAVESISHRIQIWVGTQSKGDNFSILKATEALPGQFVEQFHSSSDRAVERNSRGDGPLRNLVQTADGSELNRGCDVMLNTLSPTSQRRSPQMPAVVIDALPIALQRRPDIEDRANINRYLAIPDLAIGGAFYRFRGPAYDEPNVRPDGGKDDKRQNHYDRAV